MTDAHSPELVAVRRVSQDAVDRIPPASLPLRTRFRGRHVMLEPLDPLRHVDALFKAGHGPGQDQLWRYLPYGPFAHVDEMAQALTHNALSTDPLFFTVCTMAGEPQGVVSFLNICPAAGSIEIGHIWFGFSLQRTPAASDAIYLMIRHAVERGYRRVEWKCDAANLPSRRAAKRFGFRHEGIFYRAAVVKGHNRDTAWYSIIDEEWPAVNKGFEAWLRAENFDAAGNQRDRLTIHGLER